MKTIIKKSLLLGVVAFGMASCGENSWNDTYLDGFVGGPQLENSQSMDYTLTVADYETLATNSANKALAEAAGVSNELAAVKTLHYLNAAIDAETYIPNFLSDPSFPYFTLSDGSAVNVTYSVAKDLPEEMVNMNAASTYTVTTEDYQEAYGSDEDYAESFSPSAPANVYIPGILKANFANAESGNYVVVNYNNSETAPVFGGAAEEKDPTIGDAKVGMTMTLKGVVTGICARGFIFSDETGSLLVYKGSSYDKSYAIGDMVEVSGDIAANNYGMQYGESSVVTKTGTGTPIYGTPKVYTGADMDAAIQTTDDFEPVYCSVTGKVSVSGNYYNFIVDGASTAQGSFYMLTDEQKAMLKDGETCTVYGYFMSISKSGGSPKFFNILLVDVPSVSAAKNVKTRKVAQIANTATSALYLYDGSKWAAVSDVLVLQPSDYVEMGSSYGNLQGEQPAEFLPIFLSKKFPYAAEGDKHYVLYKYYTGTGTVLRSEQFEYDGAKWVNAISDSGVVTETSQFVKRGGSWKMDPSIELTLPVGKNQPTSTWFYQAVVDWVKANVPNAENYVDSYGTAEYYSGCSSYQGNLNVNTSYGAISGNSDYAGKSQEEIEETMWSRFENETAPGALSVLYPNMAPIGDLEPTVTITFTAWTTGGINKVYTIVFKCVAKAKFEFVSLTEIAE